MNTVTNMNTVTHINRVILCRLPLLLIAGIIGIANLLGTVSSTASAAEKAAKQDDGKLRIICFGAHPDDCEFQCAGTAAKWVKLGHHVKFVSVTNGDIGHWNMAGGPLAKRRRLHKLL